MAGSINLKNKWADDDSDSILPKALKEKTPEDTGKAKSFGLRNVSDMGGNVNRSMSSLNHGFTRATGTTTNSIDRSRGVPSNLSETMKISQMITSEPRNGQLDMEIRLPKHKITPGYTNQAKNDAPSSATTFAASRDPGSLEISPALSTANLKGRIDLSAGKSMTVSHAQKASDSRRFSENTPLNHAGLPTQRPVQNQRLDSLAGLPNKWAPKPIISIKGDSYAKPLPAAPSQPKRSVAKQPEVVDLVGLDDSGSDSDDSVKPKYEVKLSASSSTSAPAATSNRFIEPRKPVISNTTRASSTAPPAKANEGKTGSIVSRIYGRGVQINDLFNRTPLLCDANSILNVLQERQVLIQPYPGSKMRVSCLNILLGDQQFGTHAVYQKQIIFEDKGSLRLIECRYSSDDKALSTITCNVPIPTRDFQSYILLPVDAESGFHNFASHVFLTNVDAFLKNEIRSKYGKGSNGFLVAILCSRESDILKQILAREIFAKKRYVYRDGINSQEIILKLSQFVSDAKRLPVGDKNWPEQPSLSVTSSRTLSSMRQAKHSVDLVSDDDVVVQEPLRRSTRNSGRVYRDQRNMFLTPEDNEKYVIWQGFTVYRGDLRRLEPEIYLNDTLIDLANSYYHQFNAPESLREKIYVFSCQFLSKYMVEHDPTLGYQSIRRWTLNVDLFDKDFIFFPINHAHHWSLMCVMKPRLIFQQAEKEWKAKNRASDSASDGTQVEEDGFDQMAESKNENDERSCILFMDSLGMHKIRFGKVILGYLYQEWMSRKLPSYQADEETRLSDGFLEHLKKAFEDVSIIKCKVPIQENGFDCGVYVIAFFRWIIESNPETTCEAIQHSFIDVFNVSTFFPKNSTYIRDLRVEIRSITDSLSKAWLEEKEQKRLKKEAKKAAKAAALLDAQNPENQPSELAEQNPISTSTDEEDSDDGDDEVECIPNESFVTDQDTTMVNEDEPEYISRTEPQPSSAASSKYYSTSQYDDGYRNEEEQLPLVSYDPFESNSQGDGHSQNREQRQGEVENISISSSTDPQPGRQLKRKHNTFKGLFQEQSSANKHIRFKDYGEEDQSNTDTIADEEDDDDDELDLKSKKKRHSI